MGSNPIGGTMIFILYLALMILNVYGGYLINKKDPIEDDGKQLKREIIYALSVFSFWMIGYYAGIFITQLGETNE